MNGVLELSQIASGNYVPEVRWVNLEALMKNLIGNCEASLNKDGIPILWTIKGNPNVGFDYHIMESLLYQLIHNALKFTRNWGTVKIRLSIQDKKIQCLVADTGIGIAPEDYRHIFVSFRQIDDGMTRKFGGVGLGLSIVKSYVDLLGGEVMVRSLLGKGSLFFM
jgi:signal transduction histidine kinase